MSDSASTFRTRSAIPPRASQNVTIDWEIMTQFCLQYPILGLSFFGSVVRDDFHAGSDVDILVRFDPAARLTLFDKARMGEELAELFGRAVDFRTPAELSPYIRDRVLAEAEEFYVRG